jgi:hypothetical protein
MIYWGQALLPVVFFGSLPTPFPSVRSTGDANEDKKEIQLRKRGEESGRGGGEPNHTKARKPGPLSIIQYYGWSNIKNKILSYEWNEF